MRESSRNIDIKMFSESVQKYATNVNGCAENDAESDVSSIEEYSDNDDGMDDLDL